MSLQQIATQTRERVITSDLEKKDSFMEAVARKPGFLSMSKFLEIGDPFEEK